MKITHSFSDDLTLETRKLARKIGDMALVVKYSVSLVLNCIDDVEVHLALLDYLASSHVDRNHAEDWCQDAKTCAVVEIAEKALEQAVERSAASCAGQPVVGSSERHDKVGKDRETCSTDEAGEETRSLNGVERGCCLNCAI